MTDQKTLRDEFAMAALSGLLADTQVRQSWKEYARDSYDIADAMMAERAARAQGEK